MIYRRAAYIFFALTMASSVAAEQQSDADKSQQVDSGLSGYWQQVDGDVVLLSQQGSSLTSRFTTQSANNNANDLDFSATIYGNLIYGAYRGPFFRSMQKICSEQIWVGMGLTLSDDGNTLEGFRGDRIVDPTTCSAKYSDPVKLVYKRIANFDPGK